MAQTFEQDTAALAAKLQSLQYQDETIRKYEREWRRFEAYLISKQLQAYTLDTVKDYFIAHYGIAYDAPAKDHTKAMRQTMRALRSLIEFKDNGIVYRRMPSKDHTIPTGFRAPVIAFLADAETRLAKTSCRQYRSHTECFVAYLVSQGKTEFSELTPELIKSFWQSRASLTKQSKEYDAYVLRKFFDYLYDPGVCEVDFSPFVPKVKGNSKGKIPSFYTPEELSKVLSTVDRSNPTGKRDYAILLMAIRYGMRIGDIRSLKLSDFEWENDKFAFIQSKTGKRQEFFLLPEVSTALIDYFKNGRPKTTCSFVFIRHNAPYTEFGTENNLHNIISKYMNMAGITDFHHRKHGFHSLRHSIAGHLLDQGVPMPTISEVLGHSSTETTMIYSKISIAQLATCSLEVE